MVNDRYHLAKDWLNMKHMWNYKEKEIQFWCFLVEGQQRPAERVDIWEVGANQDELAAEEKIMKTSSQHPSSLFQKIQFCNSVLEYYVHHYIPSYLSKDNSLHKQTSYN